MPRTSSLKKRAAVMKQKGAFAEAAKALQCVCQQDPADWVAWLELGTVNLKLARASEAYSTFMTVLRIQNNNTQALLGMAEACLMLGKYGDAQKYAEFAYQNKSASWEACFVLGNVYREQNCFDGAEQYYRKVLQYNPAHALANYYLANMLKTQGRTDESVRYYDAALKIVPDFAEARWNKLRVLPIIYDNESQITESRDRYAAGLDELKQSLDLESPKGRQCALQGLRASTNFYLQYQGRNDLDLQEKYGEIVEAVMAANFPQWVRPLEKRKRKLGGRVKVGYCSAFLRDHNGANWLSGWLRHRSSGEFEIFCYHTGVKTDFKSKELHQMSDHFRYAPDGIKKVCEQIISDKLDILVYPELGMDPQCMMMAGLRLAPVQCVGWGHPVTSGLTTMDYWLSSDLMEPVNGQEHYLEKLVRLPNIANCYSADQKDRLSGRPSKKSRTDFGLPEDAVLYFCSQSLFKYLPQYDFLWPEIAHRVPNCKFVFVSISSVYVVKRFMARIERSFDMHNLKASDYCIMLNRQSPEDFVSLNQVMDIFLDNPPWSGHNTCLVSVDCGVPIVTWPMELMRGRHSCAILQMMGISDTIASDAESYVSMAARLGNHRGALDRAKERLLLGRKTLYEDAGVAAGLERFYRDVTCD